MSHKPLTLRSATITTAALAIGSAAGVLAEAVALRIGYTGPGAGQTATAVVSLWALDKLNALIADGE